MSDQDRFDWDDDLDFENLADEQTASEVTFAAEQDFVGEENLDSPVMETRPSDEERPASVAADQASGLGLSPTWWGLRFTFAILIAAISLAGGVIYVADVDPLSLWKPEGLLQVDQLINFEAFPTNLLYLVGVGVVLLAVLGGWAVAHGVHKAGRRHEHATVLLNKLTALRLDNEKPWQSADFKTDPQVAAFVAETLGSWRLQMAREKKNSGLEGEIRRLQKALEAKDRQALTDRFDNLVAGSLADAVVDLYDEYQVALNEIRSVRDKDATESQELMDLLQDARSWQRQTREKLAAQGVSVEKLAGQLSEVARKAESLDNSDQQVAIGAAVSDITREIEVWSSKGHAGDQLVGLNDLVDRGSKLAFQMAMEVARLGTRGERLLPMTQSLEELTNEFRQATAALADNDGAEAYAEIKRRLDQVQARLTGGAGPDSAALVVQAQNLVGNANQTRQNLQDTVQSFGNQGRRLDNLGSRLGQFSGVEFDPNAVAAGNPDNPPEGGMNISQHDPFGQQQVAETIGAAEVDPFSQPLAASPLALESPLPTAEEKVYDLAEFGAKRIDEGMAEEAVRAGAEDRIYDLGEFGAVALN
ncbi:hypothetical protein CSB20_08695 [bacterium DOLZORAL124_64_63]|nr:MAG: hypothetical protein CSB20_08695 [bacterium DOLZORAL124_64_63]